MFSSTFSAATVVNAYDVLPFVLSRSLSALWAERAIYSDPGLGDFFQRCVPTLGPSVSGLRLLAWSSPGFAHSSGVLVADDHRRPDVVKNKLRATDPAVVAVKTGARDRAGRCRCLGGLGGPLG